MLSLSPLAPQISQNPGFGSDSGLPQIATGSDKNDFALFLQNAQDNAVRDRQDGTKRADEPVRTEDVKDSQTEKNQIKPKEGDEGEKQKENRPDENRKTHPAPEPEKPEILPKVRLTRNESQGKREVRETGRDAREPHLHQDQTHVVLNAEAKAAQANAEGKSAHKLKADVTAKPRVEFIGAVETARNEKNVQLSGSVKTDAKQGAGELANQSLVKGFVQNTKKDTELNAKEIASDKKTAQKNNLRTNPTHTPAEAGVVLAANVSADAPKEISKSAGTELKVEAKAEHAKEKSDLFTPAPASRDHQIQSFQKAAENAIQRAQPAELVNRIAAQMKYAVTEGKGELTVKLNPEHLGKLQIVLGKEDGGLMTAKMIVESSAVKDLLQTHMQDLKDHLEMSGMSFGQMNVDVKSGNADTAGQMGEGKNVSFSGSGNGKSGEENDADFIHIDLRYSDRLVNVIA